MTTTATDPSDVQASWDWACRVYQPLVAGLVQPTITCADCGEGAFFCEDSVHATDREPSR